MRNEKNKAPIHSSFSYFEFMRVGEEKRGDEKRREERRGEERRAWRSEGGGARRRRRSLEQELGGLHLQELKR